MKDVIVLGIGNPLMADEGIGEAVVDELLANSEQLNADIEKAGTAGFSLLHMLAGRRKAILIDCCLMEAEPGTIKRFTPDDVESVKKLGHFSLHDADILQVISLSRQIGECPPEIVIFGIQPLAIEPRNVLSPSLRQRLGEYAKQVKAELQGFTGA